MSATFPSHITVVKTLIGYYPGYPGLCLLQTSSLPLIPLVVSLFADCALLFVTVAGFSINLLITLLRLVVVKVSTVVDVTIAWWSGTARFDVGYKSLSPPCRCDEGASTARLSLTSLVFMAVAVRYHSWEDRYVLYPV